MKNTFYFLLCVIFIFEVIPVSAQETDKTIFIFPAIGDTLDKEERDYYSFLPNVKDFEWAVFYLEQDNEIDVNVCYLVNNKAEYKLFKNYMSGLKNVNRYLEQRDRLSASTPGGQEIIVYKTDGTEIKGELISVRQNSILVFPVQGGINLIDDSDLISLIKLQDISKMELSNTRNFLGNCLLSYVTGYLGGALIAAGLTAIFTNERDNYLYAMTMAVGAVVGGIIAYFIFSSDLDEYEVNAEFDVGDLIEYARYKNFEPMYLKNIK